MKEILVGSIIGLLVGIVFVVSGYLKNRKTKQQKAIEKKSVSQQESFNVKINSLKQLKEKGILTDQEYESKTKKLEEDNLTKSLENYEEYKQLEALYEDGILTKEEFESKVEILKNKINTKEETVTEEEEQFFEGLCIFTNEDLDFGFKNEQGQIIIEPIYEYAENFNNGLALVRTNSKFGFIDRNGKIVIDIIYDNEYKAIVAKNDRDIKG